MKKSELRQIIKEEIKILLEDDKKSKVTLSYMTTEGSHWFEVQAVIHDSDYKKRIDYYIKQYQPKADKLVRKWNLDGNEEVLFPYIEGNNKDQVVRDAEAYLESLD